MQDKELRHNLGADKWLTKRRIRMDRLLDVMGCWWDGWSQARIARKHHISRQRVHQLQLSVACTRELRNRADTERRDTGRTAVATQVAAARALLLHPLAHRLTPRQRCAQAWLTQGLTRVDIAKRMSCSPQAVVSFLVSGRWRLERMASGQWRKRRPRERPVRKEEVGPAAVGCLDFEIGPIDIEALISHEGPYGRP
jgi:hypothetical protein